MRHKMMNQQILRLGGAGILNYRDITELTRGVRRVLTLMSDGGWHTAEEIELAAGEHGIPAREGLRRMRELRSFGYTIDRMRQEDTRQWLYRLNKQRT